MTLCNRGCNPNYNYATEAVPYLLWPHPTYCGRWLRATLRSAGDGLNERDAAAMRRQISEVELRRLRTAAWSKDGVVARLQGLPRTRRGQSALLGSALARPLHLLRPRLAAPGSSVLPEGEAQPLGAPLRPRGLELAASKVGHSTAFDRIWPRRYRPGHAAVVGRRPAGAARA